MEANGTMLWYYNVCKREVWLMSRVIVPDQQDENIDIGRFIHERTYKRNSKEISFGNVKFDVLFRTKNQITIGETKKTSKYAEASKWQLMYYLNQLKEAGIEAKGVLLYPEEKKRTEVKLTDESRECLQKMCLDIERICELKRPPSAEKIRFCRNCAYREYCYS
ncbi:CRISPR-associated protein Cas4 [Clostridium sp. JNZ X4-2]